MRGRANGIGERARLRAKLERRTAGRWRAIAGADVTAAGRFTLRWRTPAAIEPVLVRVTIATVGGHRVAASRGWRIHLSGSNAPTRSIPRLSGTTARTPSRAGPNIPNPPPPLTLAVAPMEIAAGTQEAVAVPEWVSVTEADDAPPFTTVVNEGALVLAAAADAPFEHHEMVVSARGCSAQQCGLDLAIHIPVDVVPLLAESSKPVTDFPSPSPDRLAEATPLPGGLPGQRLADELVVTLGTDDLPGTRADADTVAAAVGAFVTGGVEELGVFSVGWSASQDLGARRTELLAQAGVVAVSYRDLGTVGEDEVPPGDWSDDGQDVIWPFAQINAPQAWNSQQGGYPKVGIVDGARVQADHEDLNVVTRLGPSYRGSHATHVAGLACARANGIGLVGVAWDCPIVTSGIESDADEDVLAAATAVALEPGVKVVNISLGPNLDTARCATAAEHNARMLAGEEHAAWFRRLFGGGIGSDIVWTISAGNNCEDAAPSAWGQNGDLPNVIVVGATNSDGTLARFSTFGHDVEVAAPGGVKVEPPGNGTVGIWSTWLYGATAEGRPECGPAYRYCWQSGTSMAAPMVAGVAELIRSAYVDYSAADVAGCIVRSAVGAAAQSAYPTSYTPKIAFEPEDALPIVDAEAALDCVPGEFNLTIGDGTPVAGQLKEPLTVTLSAAGGTPPYEWSYDEFGGPINGLSLTGDGVLSGTPRWAGALEIPVKLTDAKGDVARGIVNVKIAYGPAPPISGHPTRLTSGNDDSRVVGISADGSSVLAVSRATNLTADPVRTSDGMDLFTIDTTTKTALRITHGTGTTDWAVMSADGSTVVFRSTATDLVPGADPNGEGVDLYAWRRSGGSITRIAPGVNTIESITDDGSKVLYTTSSAGRPRFWILATATGTATEIATDPTLDHTYRATLSGDGTKLLYAAKPMGSNLVWFIHLRDLVSGADSNLGVQTASKPKFAADATMVVYGTYQGIFNEGTGVVTLSPRQVTLLDGGINGVFNASTSTSGNCIVLHSWENELTSDLTNRGEKVYYDDLFSYDLKSQVYRRLTNTYDIDTGGAGVAVANDCSVVAFDVPPGALDPERQDAYTPRDVFIRKS